MADQQLEIPISYYLDEELWQQELQEIFYKIPLPVAMSVALPNPGDFKAMRVVGREIILSRGKDGRMNAMLNVCRHRAMKLVPEGCGNARRFTCGYHSWTYGTDGKLIGVPAEDTFGDVDREEYSLVRLACEERAGAVLGEDGEVPDLNPAAADPQDARGEPQLRARLSRKSECDPLGP
jgi:phenylpropionate dioxygenase-like ring-hydroxylating dioxygenase large terminal subunit